MNLAASQASRGINWGKLCHQLLVVFSRYKLGNVVSAFGRFSLSRHLRKGRRRREDTDERRDVKVESFVKSASSQSNMTLVKLQNILPEEETAPCVEIVDVGTASRHVEDHDSKKKQYGGFAQNL